LQETVILLYPKI